MIKSIMIDSREPKWVQQLQFGGVPKMVTKLEHGDVFVACDDGHMLCVERKTASDLLNTLRDDRLFHQMAGMAGKRLDAQIRGRMNYWPYVVYTNFTADKQGKVWIDGRKTGWQYDSVAGAMLTLQEMGILVETIAEDTDFEAAIMRLANRARGIVNIIPPRIANVVGSDVMMLSSLPGIGMERAMALLKGTDSAAWALDILTDLDDGHIQGIGYETKRRVRQALGLADGTKLAVIGAGNEG